MKEYFFGLAGDILLQKQKNNFEKIFYRANYEQNIYRAKN